MPMKMTYQFGALAAATLVVSAAYAQETSIPVIPGAKGFGIMTKAGRNGTILRVTNLNDSGAGSLRAALEATGPRTVIFERSGTITLLNKINITSGNLTVAGQTAPGPVLVKGRGIVITCQAVAGGTCANDVLFQHIAIRPGDDPGPNQAEEDNRDALGISSANGNTIRRVVVDHVSLSWSIDEIFTTWGSTQTNPTVRSYVKDVTVSNSIFSEALNFSLHTSQPHSMGVLIGSDSLNVSLYRNLLAHLGDRNPLVADDASTVQVSNNYIYRPGATASNRMKIEAGGDIGLPSTIASFKGNVMMPDPDDNNSTAYMLVRNRVEPAEQSNELQLYMDSNRIWNIANSTWWPNPIADQTAMASQNHPTPVFGNTFENPTIYLTGSNEPSVFKTTNVNVPILAWDAVRDHVLANAGARPANRDPVDTRIVNQVEDGTGHLINSPNDPVVGGYPTIPSVLVSHNAPSTSTDVDGDGYSDLEEWLHGKAREVELGVPAPPTGLVLTAGPTNYSQINLSWTDVAGESGYKIERKKGLGGTYAQVGTTNANVTSFTDSGPLAAGTQYYYRVRAHNLDGNSGYSTDVSAATAEVSGRRAHWKLDEGTGLSAADSSGNGNTGSLQLGPTWVAGRIGGGLDFDGSPTGGDDVVNAGSGTTVDDLPAVTVAAWIKVDTVGEAGNPGRIVHKAIGTAPVNGWQFVTQETNQLGFAVDHATSDLIRVTAPNAFTPGNWHHVVVTWNGSVNATDVLMYVDGVAVGSYATTTNASGARVSDASANIHLGNEPNGARTLDGALDDVRVYNRVLSLPEIQAVYRAGQ